MRGERGVSSRESSQFRGCELVGVRGCHGILGGHCREGGGGRICLLGGGHGGN